MNLSSCARTMALAITLTSTYESAIYGGELNISSVGHGIEMMCGRYMVKIICGKFAYKDAPDDSRVCNKNSLVIVDDDGHEIILSQPKNFRQEFVVDKTPVSIACAKGKDDKHYFTVEFSADPAGADSASGSVSDLFESNGSRITINGHYYDNKMKELGIPYTKMLNLCGTKYINNCEGENK